MASVTLRAQRGQSRNESALIESEITARHPLRTDGRGLLERRQIKITSGRSHARAFTEISMGQTRVTATISSRIAAPPPDRPREGFIVYQIVFGESSDGSTSGSGHSEDTRHKENALSDLLERTIRDSNIIDLESLCIVPGEKVFCITCKVAVLDNCGNLMDAAGYAVFHALKHFKRPQVTVDNSIVQEHMSEDKEPVPLSLHHQLNFSSFAFCAGGDVALSDPTDREELVSDGNMTVVANSHGELCGVFKIGGVPIHSDMLFKCVNVAVQTSKVEEATGGEDVDMSV
jgi:exosome complex component RRP45|eukprot:Stramenopile-MAST_4_protein_4374